MLAGIEQLNLFSAKPQVVHSTVFVDEVFKNKIAVLEKLHIFDRGTGFLFIFFGSFIDRHSFAVWFSGAFFNWDHADWMMLREGEDYPRLAWQEVFAGDIAGLYGVEMLDFALLASQWNESVCNETNNWCQGADIDHLDGVDIKDLLQIAEDWMKGL